MVDGRVGLNQAVKCDGVRFLKRSVEGGNDAGGDGWRVAEIQGVTDGNHAVANADGGGVGECKGEEVAGVVELKQRHVVVGRCAQHSGRANGAVEHLDDERRVLDGVALLVCDLHDVGVGQHQAVIRDDDAGASGDRGQVISLSGGHLDSCDGGLSLGEQSVEIAGGGRTVRASAGGDVRDLRAVVLGQAHRAVGDTCGENNTSRRRSYQPTGAGGPVRRRCLGRGGRRRGRERRRRPVLGEFFIAEQCHCQMMPARP